MKYYSIIYTILVVVISNLLMTFEKKKTNSYVLL